MKDKELKDLISKIEKEKKEQYDIDFSLSTPTVIEYYEEKLKNKNYNLIKKITAIREGYRCDGLVNYKSKKVVVFDKNYTISNLLKHPFQSMQGDINKKLIITLTTLHEIRHIVQNQKSKLFSDYDKFCFNLLRIPQDKYHFNKQYHDMVYVEIDANLYALKEIKKYLKLNDKQKESIEKRTNKVLYQKNSYDFEFFLDYFSKNRVEWGFKRAPKVVEIFWNKDGTFKRPREIVLNPKFKINNDLMPKILGSNTYLAYALSIDLDDEELVFLDYEILLNKEDIKKHKEVNNNLLNQKRIEKEEYEKANDYFERLLLKKDIYQELLMKKQSEKAYKIRK